MPFLYIFRYLEHDYLLFTLLLNGSGDMSLVTGSLVSVINKITIHYSCYRVDVRSETMVVMYTVSYFDFNKRLLPIQG